MTCVVRNLTPHAVTLCSGRTVVELPPDGLVARRDDMTEPTGSVDVGGLAIPCVRVDHGAISGLPDQMDGVLLIVSRVVAEALPGRSDLCFPTDLVRDADGHVVGCRSLGTFQRVGAVRQDLS